MWGFNMIAFLTAILPVVISIPTSSPIPGERCIAMTERCRDNQVESCFLREHWTVRQACLDGQKCQLNGTDLYDYRASCVSLASTLLSVSTQPTKSSSTTEYTIQTPSTTESTSVIESTSPPNYCPTFAIFRCANNTIEECGDRHTWIVKEPSSLSTRTSLNASATHPNALPPFTPTHPSSPCHPGDRACDPARRFVFNCLENRTWETQPQQCNRAGACQVVISKSFPGGLLECEGFLKYGYDDGRVSETKGSCEYTRWMACLGVSGRAWVWGWCGD